MEIKELIKEAHENAVKHGFWEDYDFARDNLMTDLTSDNFKQACFNAIGNRLMLLVSEIAEAQEGLRKEDINNFREEIADVAIRLADLCGGLGIDLEAEIEKKMEKNKDRPYKHGKAF